PRPERPMRESALPRLPRVRRTLQVGGRCHEGAAAHWHGREARLHAARHGLQQPERSAAEVLQGRSERRRDEGARVEQQYRTRMILQALNEYYNRKQASPDPKDRLPAFGLEEKEIPFII